MGNTRTGLSGTQNAELIGVEGSPLCRTHNSSERISPATPVLKTMCWFPRNLALACMRRKHHTSYIKMFSCHRSFFRLPPPHMTHVIISQLRHCLTEVKCGSRFTLPFLYIHCIQSHSGVFLSQATLAPPLRRLRFPKIKVASSIPAVHAYSRYTIIPPPAVGSTPSFATALHAANLATLTRPRAYIIIFFGNVA